jgi:hypothetical protein
VNCGLVNKDSLYFHKKNPLGIKQDRLSQIIPTRKNNLNTFNTHTLNRALMLDYRIRLRYQPISINQYNRLQNILDKLRMSSKQKKDILEEIKKEKPKNIREMINCLYRIIAINDLPYTYKELYDIVNSFTEDRKNFNAFSLNSLKTAKRRTYYWYISKTLEDKCTYLTNEEKMKVYKIVKNYYDLLRFKMNIGSNPIVLLNYLIWQTVKQKISQKELKKRLKRDIGHFTSRKYFDNPQLASTPRIKETFKQIKDNNLDNSFEEKLLLVK